MDAPPAPPVPECPRCRELEARILVLEALLRDLQDRLKPPPTKRPSETQPPAPAQVPTRKTRGAQPGHPAAVQRRAVLWRKKSFGCASQEGCRFVERILTVGQTLRLQNRNALDFLSQSIAAHRLGTAPPRLCTG